MSSIQLTADEIREAAMAEACCRSLRAKLDAAVPRGGFTTDEVKLTLTKREIAMIMVALGDVLL